MILAAAYCRVSTDKDDQANSLESQIRYFSAYQNCNPDTEIVKIYADEGISGTSTNKRKEFNKMIKDAKDGKFSLILTKEVSRFARNTVDLLNYTRLLKSYGVGVKFLLDNISTTDLDGELRLSIMASIAQEESRKTSERVKWGQKRQMEMGVVFGRSLLGYDVSDGKISVNREGAEIVRRIFDKFVFERKSLLCIAYELSKEGFKTLTGRDRWHEGVILKILRNEKYAGDLVQKKTVTPDFLTHKKVKNRGEEELITIKNHHEPIISREVFNKAQEILNQKQKTTKRQKYSLSGKIVCGICGGNFGARTRDNKHKKYVAFKCRNAIDGKCGVKCQIKAEDFYSIVDLIFECLGEQVKTTDTFYKNIIEKIVVYSRDSMEIYLKDAPFPIRIATRTKPMHLYR